MFKASFKQNKLHIANIDMPKVFPIGMGSLEEERDKKYESNVKE